MFNSQKKNRGGGGGMGGGLDAPRPPTRFKTPNYVTFLTSCELAGMHLVVMRRIQLNVFSFYSAELALLYL